MPTFSEKEVCDIIEMRLLLEHQALTDIQNKLLPMDFETLGVWRGGVSPPTRRPTSSRPGAPIWISTGY